MAPSDVAATPILTLRAKLTVNKAKLDGEVKVYSHKLTWQPSEASAAQPVSHPASSLTGSFKGQTQEGSRNDLLLPISNKHCATTMMALACLT